MSDMLLTKTRRGSFQVNGWRSRCSHALFECGVATMREWIRGFGAEAPRGWVHQFRTTLAPQAAVMLAA